MWRWWRQECKCCLSEDSDQSCLSRLASPDTTSLSPGGVDDGDGDDGDGGDGVR